MKTVGLILLMLVVQSCFFHSYYENKDREWWYFEDWDTNKDMAIDKNEFTTNFEKHQVIRRISPIKQPIGYATFDSLVVKFTRNTVGHREDKASAASFDIDGNQKFSEQELATVMFIIADDNRNNELSGLEFYEWEVYL